jgi:hypothetical protein
VHKLQCADRSASVFAIPAAFQIPTMKTEAELLGVLRDTYASHGRDPADIASVRPLHGGWYNALKFEVIRADGQIAFVWRKDLDRGDYVALAESLSGFATPNATIPLCSRCGKPLQRAARFCTGCGHVLQDLQHPARARHLSRMPRTSNAIKHTAVVVVALTSIAAGVAYWSQRDSPTAALQVEPVSLSHAMPEQPMLSEPSGHTAAVPSGPISTTNDIKTDVQRPTAPQMQATVTADQHASAPQAKPAIRRAVRSKANGTRQHKVMVHRTAGKMRPKPLPRPSVDAFYHQTAARDCAKGFTGVLCREKLKFRLCEGRWSDHRVIGQMVCHVAKPVPPLS